MYVPPDFPLGIDIYDLGRFSTDDKSKTPEFFQRVVREVSLEWAGRVHEGVKETDLTTAKVGAYEALFFEALVPAQTGKDVRWRQWVFMVDDRCYFVVSTIFPEFEASIYPSVEWMLKSFQDAKPGK